MDKDFRDTYMINVLVRNLRVLVVIATVIGSYSAIAADANKYVCEAKQNSNSELPLLSGECPIGNGLWGSSRPAKDDGFYWVQCGLMSKPMSLAIAKSLYSKISTDVWMKPEDKGFRCLIGPYESYAVAKKELKQVQTLKSYKKAFIRSVGNEITKPKSTMKPKKKPSPAKAPVAKVVPKKTKVVPPTPKRKAEPVSKVANSNQKIKKTSAGSIVLRREAKIGDAYYAIPFLMEGNAQYYMEYGIGWNRLDYNQAKQVCESQQMRLVNTKEWRALINSTVMVNKQWPIHVPYWGDGKKGLFTSGKVTQLTGTSLLNVVCVK